jgi:hypothetical protein
MEAVFLDPDQEVSHAKISPYLYSECTFISNPTFFLKLYSDFFGYLNYSSYTKWTGAWRWSQNCNRPETRFFARYTDHVPEHNNPHSHGYQNIQSEMFKNLFFCPIKHTGNFVTKKPNSDNIEESSLQGNYVGVFTDKRSSAWLHHSFCSLSYDKSKTSSPNAI